MDAQKIRLVNWQEIGLMRFTRPKRVTYYGIRREGFHNWIECYQYVVACLGSDFSDILNGLAKDPSYPFLSHDPTDLRRPLRIAENVYAEGNRNATELVKSIKFFLEKCNVSYADISIEYCEKDGVEVLPKETSESGDSDFISETDLYTYFKTQYIENHQTDGKQQRAPHHAQKCIDMIGKASALLKTDIFSITTLSDLEEVRQQLKHFYEDEHYDWYLYVLSRYEGFIKSKNVERSLHKGVDKPAEADADEYMSVIEDSFTDGFAFENPLRRKKFIRRYEEILNKPFVDSDEAFLRKIRASGFISEGKVYLASIVPQELKDEIEAYIDRSFGNTSAIYYSALYEKFNGRFNSLFSEDMLKSYLAFAFADKYRYCPDFMTQKGVQANLREELINTFMNRGRPMDIGEIYAAFPHAPHPVVDLIIRDKDFVVNYRGRSYFYKHIFNLDEEQLAKIDHFLAQSLSLRDQVSGGELYAYIANKMPEVLESNPGVTDLGIKNIMKIKLENKYDFRGDVISKIGAAVDVKSLYKGFCREREKFCFAELEEFRRSIDKNHIDWDAVISVSVRISHDTFIRRDLISFDVSKIDAAIASYCLKKYVAFADIINYTDFPTMEFHWNAFVLESYAYLGSGKYGLIHASFNRDKPVGAIVKKDSDIHSFDDLLTDVIKEQRLFDEEKAFEYLLANDYIRTRKVKNILALIERAKMEV